MKTARKIKLTSLMFLLCALPVSTLPRTIARPLAPAAPTQSSLKPAPEAQIKLSAVENYGKLPLRFESNMGQSDKQVKFLARGNGYTIFLTPNEAVFSLRDQETRTDSAVLRMKLVGGNAEALSGEQKLQGKVNYLVDDDRSKWRTNIPTFRKVHYDNVWPGVDLLWYGTQKELEYDFIIKPGGDVSQVRLSFAGVDQMRIDESGNLMLKSNGEEVTHSAPIVYQELDHGRVGVPGKYVVGEKDEIGFAVGEYDRNKPLVIDPILIYSSYIGGDSFDEGFAVGVDGLGQAYLAGKSTSSEASFPQDNATVVENAGTDPLGFITKLNANGTDTIYSTFFGNISGFVSGDFDGTRINAIAVSSDGKAALTGAVSNADNSSKFPLTQNAFQKNGFCIAACGFEPSRQLDSFVTLLSSDGTTLLYSTFFGGSTPFGDLFSERGFDEGLGIAMDAFSRIYITGLTASNNLPTKNAFQTSRRSGSDGKDAFVAVFDPFAAQGKDSLLYSSYLGGDGDDLGRGIAVDTSRNAYVVGSTASTDLETTAPLAPLQATFRGGAFDGFVAKVDTGTSGASSLTYLTYFGGNINDRVESVAVDAFQRAYITGASNSSPTSFPLRNAFDSTQTNGEAFVAKLNADGTALFYCSFLGGDNTNGPGDGEEGLGIALDFGGNAYVTGRTTSGASFPSVNPLQSNFQGTAFLAKIEASISGTTTPKLLYSTTFGGSGAKAEAIAVDTRGNVYLGGTTSGGLTTTVGAFDTVFNGGANDGFIARLGPTFNDTIGIFRPSLNQFHLRNSNSAGPADLLALLGQSGDQPIAGDWDGAGTDKPGVFRPSTGQFLLQLSFNSIVAVNFGQEGDLAVVGDWDGNGIDTPGVFTPATGQWKLTNGFKGQNVNNNTPVVNLNFSFGQSGDTPLAGDWDGNGIDTVGLYTNAKSIFRLSNGFKGSVDFPTVVFGNFNTRPIAGDWDGDGIDTIGVFNQVTAVMALNNAIIAGDGEIVFNFGQSGDIPLAGDWDGKPSRP